MLRLPARTSGYTVSRVTIPMRDGVELVADHYVPAGEPVGTLLLRGPYGRGFPFSLLYGALYAARGYHVLMQSVRGTFDSGGTFAPMAHEAADGADTVAWLRRQPWFTGRFATIGISYLGFTQWALLQDPPPELAAAVITAGPHDFSESAWGTGSFTVNDFLGWSYLVAHQEDPGRIRGAIRQIRARKSVIRATGELPLGAAGRKLLGARAPWWESWLDHPDDNERFWSAMRFGAALDRAEVPVLLIGGWQDLFLQQTLQQYRRLRDRGVDVALTMGPWTHTQLLFQGLRTIAQESQGWLDTHLGGRPGKPRPARVHFHVAGEGWRDAADWPPATTERALYLQPGGDLTDTPPTSSAVASVSFRYDPADPTPTIGGRLLSPDGGYRDDTALAARSDVLSFTSDVLTEDLCVIGNPVAELAHTCDNPHADVFARISEVDAKGRSRNVSDGYRRLTDTTDSVRLELDAIAHRFGAGARIRVLIAGGSHPRYARNLGTGEPTATGAQLKPSTHELHFGASRVLLPVERA
ncbi:CocE/NonD family hydrolase [Candidatus Mycobacterium methanotrophicum]|uniref:CocE/NonD family hydrolase n=2 Tax=Candidatus Mycobacterium methanotrophicum TaxID=2943498 RepID=A0ABY4QT56_9MYCO|nr:CocE/NonD family hydrolase [Candidatus Mycobacterium methanotrophicum]UQX13215.1 CocE/NonD family hydrolase [Candidatus Mycobacterium methanotrophicum]